jgi:hypothetical protein
VGDGRGQFPEPRYPRHMGQCGRSLKHAAPARFAKMVSISKEVGGDRRDAERGNGDLEQRKGVDGGDDCGAHAAIIGAGEMRPVVGRSIAALSPLGSPKRAPPRPLPPGCRHGHGRRSRSARRPGPIRPGMGGGVGPGSRGGPRTRRGVGRGGCLSRTQTGTLACARRRGQGAAIRHKSIEQWALQRPDRRSLSCTAAPAEFVLFEPERMPASNCRVCCAIGSDTPRQASSDLTQRQRFDFMRIRSNHRALARCDLTPLALPSGLHTASGSRVASSL